MEVLGLDVKREHARSTVRAAEISLVALEPRLLGVSSGASRRFLASSILILIPPSGLMQSYCSRRMALNKQFCEIEPARLQGLGPLTLTRHGRFRLRRLSTSGHVGLRQSSLGPLQILDQHPRAVARERLRRGVGIATGDVRHDRGVDYPETVHPADPEPCVYHR